MTGDDRSGPCCAPGRATDQASPGPSTARTPEAVAPSAAAGPALVAVPETTFAMGDAFAEGYPSDGETPVHAVHLDGYQMSATPVTNAMYASFVAATGYRTEAEEFGMSAVFYHLFTGDRRHIVSVVEQAPWWYGVAGASWQAPEGPGSDVGEREHHPVVHVSYNDAQAYCSWAGMRLPTEAEWECAARGGLSERRFPWGDDLLPEGSWMTNIWQGRFPDRNTEEDGYLGTAPVTAYSPNGLGFWQTSGNVWEWCADWFAADYYANSPTRNPAGPPDGVQRVIRGGSYLCHDSYCHRYRVAARSANTPDSSAGNIGFRVAGRSPRDPAPRDPGVILEPGGSLPRGSGPAVTSGDVRLTSDP